jgi:hypothetical protein
MLSLALLDCNGAALGAENSQSLPLPEVRPGSGARYQIKVRDQICFELRNSSRRSLYATLIDVAASGRVIILAHQVQLPPGSCERIWLDGTLGLPFEASLPDSDRVGVDRLVVVATTRAGVDFRHLATTNTFAAATRSATRSHARDFGASRAPEPLVEQWTADSASVRIVADT